MPQGHHHHENQRDKRAECLMRLTQHEKSLQVMNRPLPLIDIGIERISELIKSVIGEHEDTFQDAWVAVLDDHHVGCEEDILRIAKEIDQKNKKAAREGLKDEVKV